MTTRRNWRAPRYCFRQRCADIRRVFCAACARVGVHYTDASDTVYVSRQCDATILDRFLRARH